MKMRNLIRKRNLTNKACFGAGCYWGTEKFLFKDFNLINSNSLISGQVGFMSPYLNKKYLNPSYEDVCQGNTSLIEVYNFNFHGNNEIYEKLCWFFFSFHDPTTINRQGFDIGTQYASVIFYYDDTQRDIAINVKEKLQHILNTQKNVIRYSNKEIVTEIKQATTFYPAPEYHQQYLTKNPGGYCNHFYRFDSTQFHK